MRKIKIQIHDYDTAGRYLITEDREGTIMDAIELKRRARSSVKAAWDKLPKEARHIVYYAELLDKSGEVYFAAIYMHGEAYTEDDFFRIFGAHGVGYVGAIHKWE